MQYLFPLLAVFIWAGNTVVNKLAVGVIQPAEIGFFRWLLVGLALTPFMLGPVLRNRRYILANLGTEPVVMPAGTEVLLASGDTATDTDGAVLVPSDTTVWVRATA